MTNAAPTIVHPTAYTGRQPFPWQADAGDGTYRNPILCADYSDPDVIADGDDFWMTASSFNCVPGLPILHSRDLVNWSLVGHALPRLPDPRGVHHTPQHGCGVWAPAIRQHAGLFWIFFPMVDEGVYVTTATSPRGPWSEPWCVMPGAGLIDPCPLWDDDGRAYLVFAWARSRTGIKNRLSVVEMSPDARALIGQPTTVFDEPERHPTCEGPKFHKRNGYYFISAPAGGVATGWQLILRSRDVFGPYEEKVVLAQGDTPINGPHQGAIVETARGESWFVHFQDAEVYGRIAHLQPVEWVDDWPLMGERRDAAGCGQPVLAHAKPRGLASPILTPPTSDEFDDARLGPQWQWHANPCDSWHSLADRPGMIRLRAVATPDEFLKAASLLLQKFPATSFIVDAEVHLKGSDPHAQAGLIVMGEQHAALVVANGPDVRQVCLIVNDVIKVRRRIDSCGGVLRVRVESGGRCTFGFGLKGEPIVPVGDSFQAVPGKWIGAKIGLFCRTLGDATTDAYADVDYFRFAP